MKIAVLLFDDVEILDFAGPMEVFSHVPVQMITIASTPKIVCKGDLQIQVHHTLDEILENNISFEYILLPGGPGARNMDDTSAEVLWLQKLLDRRPIPVLSVCTGSFIAALSKKFDHSKMTTHHMRYDLFRQRFPQINLVESVKYCDDGILSSSGVSSGIDMSLYFVGKHFGEEKANEIAKIIEYGQIP